MLVGLDEQDAKQVGREIHSPFLFVSAAGDYAVAFQRAFAHFSQAPVRLGRIRDEFGGFGETCRQQLSAAVGSIAAHADERGAVGADGVDVNEFVAGLVPGALFEVRSAAGAAQGGAVALRLSLERRRDVLSEQQAEQHDCQGGLENGVNDSTDRNSGTLHDDEFIVRSEDAEPDQGAAESGERQQFMDAGRRGPEHENHRVERRIAFVGVLDLVDQGEGHVEANDDDDRPGGCQDHRAAHEPV